MKIPYIAYACLRTHRHMYSVEYSDKIRLLQLWHSQVLPGYPHSSAGAYARAGGSRLKYLVEVGACMLTAPV